MTELRGIAQSFSVADIFSMDKPHLIQAIEAKQLGMMPKPEVVIEKPAYDARLMTRPPSRLSDADAITALLSEHIARGLKLSFSEEQWFMSCGKVTDQGTLRMPLRTVMQCANKVMNAK
jgi:hypothetical protein